MMKIVSINMPEYICGKKSEKKKYFVKKKVKKKIFCEKNSEKTFF